MPQDNMPRAIREATRRECNRARRYANYVCHWRAMTFYRHDAECVIVRAGFDGIDGGWRYHNLSTMEMDWTEIAYVSLSMNDGGSIPTKETQNAHR